MTDTQELKANQFYAAEVAEQEALQAAGGLASDKTLRDEFAGLAMAAIISKSPFLSNPEDWTSYNKTVIGAYDYADAMLEARKTPTEDDA